MFDGKAFGEDMVTIVRGYVDRTLAPLLKDNKALGERVAALAAELAAAREVQASSGAQLTELAEHVRSLPKLDQGEIVELAAEKAAALIDVPVVEPDADAINAQIAVGIEKAIEGLPAVEPLAPDMAAIEVMVADKVRSAVAESAVDPVPPDMNAIESVIGAAVSQQVAKAVADIPLVEPLAPDMAALAELVAKAVRDAVDALPKPKDGSDGVGLTAALIDREGNLVLTMADGHIADVGRVVGKDGEHGVPFGPDDIGMDLMEDGRTLKMSFSKGDTAFEFNVQLPVPVYRGVWQEDAAYVDGDMVTWAGSAWHCNAEKATGKPGASPGEWTLAVKAGRPGRDKN